MFWNYQHITITIISDMLFSILQLHPENVIIKFLRTHIRKKLLFEVPNRVTDDEPVFVLQVLGDEGRYKSAGRAGDDGAVLTEGVNLSVDATLQLQVLVHTLLQTDTQAIC